MFRADAGRLAGVVLASASIALSLGMIFPVQHELDTAAYSRSDFAVETEIAIDESNTERVTQALEGHDVTLESVFLTDFFTATASLSPGELLVISSTTSPDLGFMPTTSLVEGPADVTKGPWIDVSADVASELEVHPGDPISFSASPTQKVEATVRAVYAVRETGTAGFAQISADALRDVLPADQVAPTQLLTSASPDEVLALLNDPFFSAKMEQAGYTSPYSVVTQPQLLDLAESQSRANLGLVLAVSVLALFALLAFACREVFVFFANARERVELLEVLGFARSRSALLLGATAVIVSSAVLLAAGGVARSAYTAGVLGPVLPPALAPFVWVAVAASIVIAAVVAVVSAARIRQWSRA